MMVVCDRLARAQRRDCSLFSALEASCTEIVVDMKVWRKQYAATSRFASKARFMLRALRRIVRGTQQQLEETGGDVDDLRKQVETLLEVNEKTVTENEKLRMALAQFNAERDKYRRQTEYVFNKLSVCRRILFTIFTYSLSVFLAN